MNGTKILLDTNIVLRLFQGDAELGNVLQGAEPYLSLISELELLGNKCIPRNYQKYAEMFVADCHVVDLNDGINELTRYIQWEYGLKLPDALVAGTAMFLCIPLISGKPEFGKVKELIFVFYQ
nr:PIN domain-containing protein [uncultured Dyadobacter sp.]